MSRSAPIALLALLGAGCSSDVARFRDPISNPFKRDVAQATPSAVPPSYGASGRSALPSSDDVIRRPRRNAEVAVSDYGNQAQTAASGYAGQARSTAQDYGNQARQAATAPINKARGAVSSSPFSFDNADDGLATGSLPARPKQMMMVKPSSGGWTAVGGTSIRVGDGETIETLSRRYGVPSAAIAQANRVPANQALAPGQSIVIPTYSLSGAPASASPAPVAAAPQPAQPSQSPRATQASAPRPASAAAVPKKQAAAQPAKPPKVGNKASHDDGDITASIPQRGDAKAGAPLPSPNGARLAWLPGKSSPVGASVTTHTVAMGDSLGSIARRYNVSAADLARSNGLGAGQAPRIGQVLKIPSSRAPDVTQTAARERARASVAAVQNSSAGRAADQSATASIGRSATAKPARQAADQVSAQPVKAIAHEGPHFMWPAKGKIIGGYEPGRRDGIAMAMPEGTPVKAAADGVVAYAGNELKGYGNVVLIRHADGYVSAYAHTKDMLVKRGESVKAGQVVAKSGQSGSVSTPQLHFEIRKGRDAVNPTTLLKS